MFTRMTGLRFSGSGERPTTSATALPTHGHTPEHPILADFNAPFVVTLNVLSLPPHLFGVRFLGPALLEPGGLPLSKKASRSLRTVATPSWPNLPRCKHATGRDPEYHHPIATLLAGNASIRPPFAAMAVG